MSTLLTMAKVEAFASQTVEPGRKARALAAALLSQSEINADNHAHVEAVVQELVTLASLTIV